jgi:hypothetical protein
MSRKVLQSDRSTAITMMTRSVMHLALLAMALVLLTLLVHGVGYLVGW